MDSRTRVKHAIERRPIDRIPRYDSFWEDTVAAWHEQGLPRDAELDEFFGWDFAMMYVDLSMRQEERVLANDGEYVTVQDRFGYTVRKAVGKSRSLEFSNHATRDKAAWNELKPRFRLDPDGPARLDDASYFLHLDDYPTWDEAKRRYDRVRATSRYVLFVGYGPWEGTWRHRGYPELMMDTALDPAWVGEMGETLVDLLTACLDHFVRLDMKPDGLLLIDDVGCTRGMLFSPATWRSLYKPLYRALGSFLHERDITFWLHSCGAIEPIIGDLIDCGLDVLQPLQARAGMDVRTLKPKYGDRLTFWGNIDATKMSGPAEECEAEVRDKIACASQGGGYIYHSDHSVPPEVTFERYQWSWSRSTADREESRRGTY